MSSTMSTALITGITGQDGSYLGDLLLAKGYRVIGAFRDGEKNRGLLPIRIKAGIELVAWDMLDQERMLDVLMEYRPTEIYNLAAYSSGAGMYDDPISVA